eukprot:scaffold1811_cov67-Skeletonema_dohrnii-CCMP3373.AAC.3
MSAGMAKNARYLIWSTYMSTSSSFYPLAHWHGIQDLKNTQQTKTGRIAFDATLNQHTCQYQPSHAREDAILSGA